MDKYIFQIVPKGDDVLIIIHDDINKFIALINQDTFKLPYLKNKDMLKFISKILDKYSDSILKMNYSLESLDADNIKLNIYIYDGEEHNYTIILKSKDTLDIENLENKINEVKSIYDKKILDLDRKYDDVIDELHSKINIENNSLKNQIQMKQSKNEYRNYKFKSIQIIKSMNKLDKFIEILEEVEEFKYTKINDTFYEQLYNEVKKYDHFIEFINKLYNEKTTNDPLKKIKFVYYYLINSNIFNIMEFIFNFYGIIQIIYLNIDYNKSTNKLILTLKFLYDNSESKNYKCLPSLFNQDLTECKLIYQNINNTTILKKDNINVFIFEKLK
jgi:hypothetical protein